MARGTSTYEQPPERDDEVIEPAERPAWRRPVGLQPEPEPEPEPEEPEPGRPRGTPKTATFEPRR